jgi:hypothetical protein
MTIESEFLLSEFEAGNGSPNIHIRKGKINSLHISDNSQSEASWTTEKEAYRFIADAGAFLIREGNEIIVDPESGADENYVSDILIKLGLSILLHQRGFLVLHGSAVYLKNEANVFLGPSGSGKSTIAAALSRRHPLIADDLVAVKASANDIKVYPAVSKLKLLPDSLSLTGYDTNALPRNSPQERKRAAQPKQGCFQEPLSLGTIYFLKEGEKLKITPLSKNEAMMTLVHSTFPLGALKAGVKATHHFMQCAIVAKCVPMFYLIRPRDMKILDESAAIIEG